jgi:hypothetical protein
MCHDDLNGTVDIGFRKKGECGMSELLNLTTYNTFFKLGNFMVSPCEEMLSTFT